MSKIFHDIAFNQKSQFSIWKQVWTLHFTACSTVYSYNICIFIHHYSCSVKKKKKTTERNNNNNKIVLLQQTGNLSVTPQHVAIWILILSTYIPEENCISCEHHSPGQSVWSLSLWPGVVTQDSQESQTFVAATLKYANY